MLQLLPESAIVLPRERRPAAVLISRAELSAYPNLGLCACPRAAQGRSLHESLVRSRHNLASGNACLRAQCFSFCSLFDAAFDWRGRVILAVHTYIQQPRRHHADIRRSTALSFLDALMAVAPRQVAAGYLAPALQHFAYLLSQGGRSASIASRSLPLLLKVTWAAAMTVMVSPWRSQFVVCLVTVIKTAEA